MGRHRFFWPSLERVWVVIPPQRDHTSCDDLQRRWKNRVAQSTIRLVKKGGLPFFLLVRVTSKNCPLNLPNIAVSPIVNHLPAPWSRWLQRTAYIVTLSISIFVRINKTNQTAAIFIGFPYFCKALLFRKKSTRKLIASQADMLCEKPCIQVCNCRPDKRMNGSFLKEKVKKRPTKRRI